MISDKYIFAVLFSIINFIMALLLSCSDKPKSTEPYSPPPITTYEGYFNQKPPGNIPKLFADGIVTTNLSELGITFSPDGKECFFTRHVSTQTIMTSKEIDGEWPEPVVCDFSGRFNDLEPLLSPDGSKLLFGSRRNVPDAEIEIYLHQWYLTKDGEEWSDAMPLEPPFRDIFVMYPTLTNDGSIYFTGGDV